MKLGINAAAFGKRLKINMDLVHHAEKLGFDSAWTAEAYGNDAVTAATWIAAKQVSRALSEMASEMPERGRMRACATRVLSSWPVVTHLFFPSYR